MVRPAESGLQRELRSGADTAAGADGGHPADRGRRVAKIYGPSEYGCDRPEQRSNMARGASRTQRYFHTVKCDIIITL